MKSLALGALLALSYSCSMMTAKPKVVYNRADLS